jgi:DNA-binding CsgD family transcriptional regulator
MYTPKMTWVKSQIQPQHLELVDFENSQRLALLQAVIEGLSDGILIINEQGELVYANERAKCICSQMRQGITKPNSVPPTIWHICQILIESRSLFSDKTIVFSDDIVTKNSDTFSIRVQWLNLSLFEYPCLLVMIKNPCHSLQTTAIAEAQIYSLTPSETKVWLLYRANYTYKQIAAELYITINTVKKHMKNIHAKRQAILTTENE